MHRQMSPFLSTNVLQFDNVLVLGATGKIVPLLVFVLSYIPNWLFGTTGLSNSTKSPIPTSFSAATRKLYD